MTISIQLLTAKEEIMVGDTSFPCRATTGGGLSVAGHEVRSITLGERNQLLALTTGADRPGQVATLVREAATGSLDASTDRDVVDAIEAVALHLAGASLLGSLARTTLLVGRSMGEAAAGITALEADRLADAIEEALALPNRTSAGWTTISYPSGEPGSSSTAGPESGRSVVSVRDELAALLIGRDEEPLSGDLADALLRRTDVASNADIPVPSGARHHDDANGQTPGDQARTDRAHGDRTGDRAVDGADAAAGGGVADLPGSPTVDRWAPSAPPAPVSGSAGSTATGAWARDLAPASGAAGGGSHALDRADGFPAVAAASAHDNADIRQRPFAPVSPSTPSGPSASPGLATRWGAETAPFVGTTRGTATAPNVELPYRSAPGDLRPRPAGRPRAATGSRVDDAVGDPNVPAVTFDLERAAMALHRAADLRGASR